MSTDTLFSRVSTILTSERIEAYRRGDGDTDVLAKYIWNACMCEALYPALQNLEIGLRNSLHLSISYSFSRDDWYEDLTILDDWGLAKIAQAKSELARWGKPETPGRIVAELEFGFWTSLLATRYNDILWSRRGLLKHAFLYMPKGLRHRHRLAGRFSDIRKLRNRVFHHEPIWYHTDLSAKHDNILEAMDWLNPVLRELTGFTDRFKAVCDPKRRDEIRQMLDTL